MDASIVAVYGRGADISRKVKYQVLRKSWESYTKQVVISANPEYLICVGKGVAGVVNRVGLATFFSSAPLCGMSTTPISLPRVTTYVNLFIS